MTTFNGFQSPNFTQIPNEYIDYTLSPDCNLTKTQMRIMNLFFRETFGWQDKFRALVLSLSDIMTILGISKKNSVIDALNGLVEDEKFLESIEVSKLSKRVKSNIEKMLGRTLQPRQKLYRLNLLDRQSKSWDFAYETHIDIQERKEERKGGNQKVTTGGNQKVTTGGNQKVTTLEVESLEAVSSGQSLNKGLNKDLNKLEEEEVSPSDLVSFLISKGITLDNALKFETRLLEKGIEGFTYEQVIKAIEWSLEKFLEGKCDEPYIYAVGRLERVLDGKVKEVANKPKNKASKKKPVRTERLPDWFEEEEQQETPAPKQTEEEKRREIEEMLKKLRD